MPDVAANDLPSDMKETLEYIVPGRMRFDGGRTNQLSVHIAARSGTTPSVTIWIAQMVVYGFTGALPEPAE